MEPLKLTAAQVVDLLAAAGVQLAEIVTDEAQATPDFDVDNILVEVDKERSKIIRPQIEAEITKEVKTQVTGQVNGAMRSAVARTFKAAGVTNKDLEGKSEDELLKFALDKHDSKLGADTQGLREQMTQMAESHAADLEAAQVQAAKELQDAKDRYTERDIDAALRTVVDSIPRIGGDAAAQTQALKTQLRSSYNLVYDEATKSVLLRDKADREKPVLNAQNTKELATAEASRSYFDSLGLVAKDNRHVNPQDAMNNSGAGNNDNGTPPAQFAGTMPGGALVDVQNHLNKLAAPVAQ